MIEDASPHTAVTITLPSVPPSTLWQIEIQNASSFAVTIARNGLLIDTAAANLTLAAGTGIEIRTDGTNYFTERGIGSVSPLTWVKEIPSGTLNGSNLSFSLSNAPAAGSLTLFLNIDQREGTDFTITGPTISFTVAPKASDTGWIYARYQH